MEGQEERGWETSSMRKWPEQFIPSLLMGLHSASTACRLTSHSDGDWGSWWEVAQHRGRTNISAQRNRDSTYCNGPESVTQTPPTSVKRLQMHYAFVAFKQKSM
ncbi:hypothetical protein PAMP_016970 [Pampus punctatissimus]